MQIVSRYPDGVFSWVDLGTTDTKGAKAFYGGLFGWSFLDMPTDSGTIYSMAQIEGKMVAGLGPLMGDPSSPEGTMPYWSAYVNHSDVDGVAERAGTAGGQVLMPPMDVMDSGRMTVIQDPTGAVVGSWQPAGHTGAQLVNVPNTLVWTELQTRDVEAAKAFYHAVFDWHYEVDANGYVSCNAGDRSQAGIMAIDETWGDVPPNWAVYFLVDDVDEAVSRAESLGGKAIVPPSPAGDIGRLAVLQDPQGAIFHIITFHGPAAPPPGY